MFDSHNRPHRSGNTTLINLLMRFYATDGGKITIDKMEKAAKAANIHDFITHLPQGYDTVLSENGVKMLILDEATSNVDTRTEQYISAAMRALMKDKTCFVIAHRLSTIQNADMILVVNGGDIVEKGTHSELMEQSLRPSSRLPISAVQSSCSARRHIPLNSRLYQSRGDRAQ